MIRIRHLLSLLMVLAGATAAGAGEIAVDYPDGFSTQGTPPYDASADGVVVVAYRYQTSDPFHNIDESLVIQARPDGTTFLTGFDGKVFDVEYSADGQRLLVMQTDAADLGVGEIRVHLLDDEGTTLWSKTDFRGFHFSLTGDAIFAWDTTSAPIEWGRSVEIFDLSGTSVRTVSLDAEVRGAIVPDDGSRVVFLTPRSVVALSATDPGTIDWRLDLPGAYPSIAQAYPVDGTHFAIGLERAASMVVDAATGATRLGIDPQALGTADPVKEPHDYAAYRVFAGPSPGTVTLFDGTAVSYTVDMATEQYTPSKLETAAPYGTIIGDEFPHRSLFLFSPTGVIVRDLG